MLAQLELFIRPQLHKGIFWLQSIKISVMNAPNVFRRLIAKAVQRAVLDHPGLGDVTCAGDLRVGDKVSRRTVNRDHAWRLHPVVKPLEVSGRWMTGDVDRGIAIRHDLDTEPA